MNNLIAIQKRSKHNRWVFDCYVYKGSLINGILKKRFKLSFNDWVMKKDLTESLEKEIRLYSSLEINQIDNVTIILGQKYNGNTFFKIKDIKQ